MPSMRKKNLIAVKMQNGLINSNQGLINSNQDNEESSVVANNILQGEGEKKQDINENNETVLTSDRINDNDVVSSRMSCKKSNLNNKKQSHLVDNRAECMKNKTHLVRRQHDKCNELFQSFPNKELWNSMYVRNDVSNLQVCDENANDESSLPEPIASAR